MSEALKSHHQDSMRQSEKGVYGELMAETNAVVAAALKRIDTRRRGHRGSASCVIVEHRHSSGGETRTYGVSPSQARVMASVYQLSRRSIA